MSNSPTPEESDFPTPQEMEGWLRRETQDVNKAAELRLKEATSIVTSYSKGELSPEQAAERTHEYSSRWGEPLPGVFRSQGMTDEEILARVNETRTKQGALKRQPTDKTRDGSSSPSR